MADLDEVRHSILLAPHDHLAIRGLPAVVADAERVDVAQRLVVERDRLRDAIEPHVALGLADQDRHAWIGLEITRLHALLRRVHDELVAAAVVPDHGRCGDVSGFTVPMTTNRGTSRQARTSSPSVTSQPYRASRSD